MANSSKMCSVMQIVNALNDHENSSTYRDVSTELLFVISVIKVAWFMFQEQ